MTKRESLFVLFFFFASRTSVARISFGPKKLVPVEGSFGLPGLVRYKLSSRDPSPVHETSAVRVLCFFFFFFFFFSFSI